jgi:23S rRNA (cytidine2498-2'-O)-methyltransferase
VGAEPGLGSRAGLVAREALSRLRERRRRAHRRYVTPEDAAASPGEVGLLVQVLMVARDRAWISVAAPRPLPHGGFDLSPWPGGAPAIARDRAPPSRAYRKLEEAFLWMGQAPGPGELCVDLGAAPGGWSAAALARGARVVAVDRAPLAPSLAGHPHLTLVRGSAFAFEPPRPADWLLTDVICEPERTVALIQRWVTRRWCRKVVASIKLKGRGGDRLLGEARAALEACGWGHVRIKHLHHNKNEVTVMMMAGERG